MKTALAIVSVVAILAIGGLAAVLVTGWTINDDAVTDSQANWCMTNLDLVAVAASNLHMHSTTSLRNWAAVVRIQDLVDGAALDGVTMGDLMVLVREDFFTWLRELGVGESIIGDTGSVVWTKPMSDNSRVQRACLAAWGAEFGTP